MKNALNLLGDKQNLAEIPEVKELLSYISELEDLVVDKDARLRHTKENVLLGVVKDIFESTTDILNRDEENIRFKLGEKIDFKKALESLCEFLVKMDEDYRLNL